MIYGIITHNKSRRVYLDNCCYNRLFDEQGQLRVRLETEAKLEIQSRMRLGLLVRTFGDVDAERFIALTNREPMDYTRWRKRNIYVGEGVHEVAERARAAAARYFGVQGQMKTSVRQDFKLVQLSCKKGNANNS